MITVLAGSSRTRSRSIIRRLDKPVSASIDASSASRTDRSESSRARWASSMKEGRCRSRSIRATLSGATTGTIGSPTPKETSTGIASRGELRAGSMDPPSAAMRSRATSAASEAASIHSRRRVAWWSESRAASAAETGAIGRMALRCEHCTSRCRGLEQLPPEPVGRPDTSGVEIVSFFHRTPVRQQPTVRAASNRVIHDRICV